MNRATNNWVKGLAASALLTLGIAWPLLALEQAGFVAIEKETEVTAASLRDKALGDETAYALLTSLTTEIGPRLAGTPAEWRAADWAVAKFKAMGFDKVWVEKAPIPVWTRQQEKAAIISPFPQPLAVTALGHSVSTPTGGVTAEVVSFKDYQALANADPAMLQGKIAYIGFRMERHHSGRGYSPAVIARSAGASIAASKGARALLIRSIGTDDWRTPHTGVMNYDPAHPKIAAAALANPDADQLERALEQGPVSLSLTIETTMKKGGNTPNIVAEITGREMPNEYVVLGSHIDSWDLGTGAIDDGAGVAVTMAAAKLIGDHQRRPRRTLRVILFGAEEIGLFGARAYAARHKANAHQFILAAESDFGADKVLSLATRVGNQSLPAVDAMLRLMGPLGVTRANRPAFGGPDVGQLRAIGIPVMDLVQDGTRYFDFHHTANDVLAIVDPDAIKQNVAAWVVFAYVAADWPGNFRENQDK